MPQFVKSLCLVRCQAKEGQRCQVACMHRDMMVS